MTLAVSKPGQRQRGREVRVAAGTAVRARQVSCCHPPPARAEGQHYCLTCDRTDLVPAMGSSPITACAMLKAPTILFAPRGMGEAPLCSSFSVWHLLREDGNIVELHLALESPQRGEDWGQQGCSAFPARLPVSGNRPFPQKYLLIYVRPKKTHRMNVQIYFFMSKMFPCESLHCRACTCLVAGGDAQLD